MSSVLDLVREDLREFAGYASARRTASQGRVWLNANESPWPNPAADASASHRYPEPQPPLLRQALATLYGVAPEQLLVGRGSDEAIDLLVRALCRAGRDAVVIVPPVFGMYAVSARLQGVPLLEVPLQERDDGFFVSVDAIADAALAGAAKLVFVCSPANPTGQALTLSEIADLAERMRGRALLVVDEAYGEYSEHASAAMLLERFDNVAVLRTLSKAHALAAVRIGAVLAAAELIAVLRNCQAPYPLPEPCVRLALAALSAENQAITRERVATVIAERARVARALQQCSAVRRVYNSQGNYLLVRFVEVDQAFASLHSAGVIVRDMRAAPLLPDALRISIGSYEDNQAMLAALMAVEATA